MRRLRFLWETLTGAYRAKLANHEQRLSQLESKVAVIEGLDAFRRMVEEVEA